MDAEAQRLTAGVVPPVPGGASRCCGGSTRRPTLTDYIDRGLRRRRAARLPISGGTERDDGGRFARFSVRVADGVITDVAFDATMCVTLVAYCEVAAERATGLTVPAAARRIRPEDLAAELPLVPASRRPLALLAARAWMATVIASTRSLPG